MCSSHGAALWMSRCHWHWSHLFTYSLESWAMIGQQYIDLMTFLAKARALKCFPSIHSFTSAGCKRFLLSRRVKNLLWYKVPSFYEYKLAFLFTRASSTKSAGSTRYSMYIVMSIIQDGCTMSLIATIITPRFFMLSLLKVSRMKEWFSHGWSGVG